MLAINALRLDTIGGKTLLSSLLSIPFHVWVGAYCAISLTGWDVIGPSAEFVIVELRWANLL
ncbi:MAG: hypothetical protein ACTS53_01765 [Candidatus Hodgkinia cicadicola]